MVKTYKAIIIDERDNVATAIEPLDIGDLVHIKIGGKVQVIKIKERIPIGHKLAIYDIENHQPVIKYGETIGLSKGNISKGEHVHIHNVISPSRKVNKT